MIDINLLLFDDFETLDIFGPIEILGKIEEYNICYYSENGGIITNAQKARIITEPIKSADWNGILVIPGGRGTRNLVNDAKFIKMIRNVAEQSNYCLSICTGSALLAKSGVLEHRRATSNKNAMEWVKSVNENVHWIERARWVTDGKYYTSSGVSAGMDMTFGFISDCFGKEKAEKIANHIEYIWNSDSTNDIFAK